MPSRPARAPLQRADKSVTHAGRSAGRPARSAGANGSAAPLQAAPMLSILGPTAFSGVAGSNQMGTGLRTAQLIALQHTAGNRAVARLVSDRGAASVQRAGGAGGAVAESPVKTVALQAVSNAPDVPP